jgi:hypothetical protein
LEKYFVFWFVTEVRGGKEKTGGDTNSILISRHPEIVKTFLFCFNSPKSFPLALSLIDVEVGSWRKNRMEGFLTCL